MSSFRSNRAQSAFGQPLRRSATTVEPRPTKKRSATTMNEYETESTVIAVPAWRRLDQSSVNSLSNGHRRPKTSSVSTMSSSQVLSDTLPTTEIERLLRSLEREDKRAVKVNCLADYRRLVETIDLRDTPLDQKSLCTLQQRENRIVQKNACRDTRFGSLLDSLVPRYYLGYERKKPSENVHNNISEYPPVSY